MTNADKLATQILAVQTLVGRRFHPAPDVNENIARQCAAFMDRNGTTDVRDLRYHYAPATDGLAFFFDVRTAHVYDPARAFTIRIQDQSSDGSDRNLFMLANAASNNFALYVVFTPDGFPVFLGSYWPESNPWQAFVHGALFVVGAVVMVAVPALAATIGSAVLGSEVAAAYPLLAEGIGNIAVQTVLDGGDVQRAVVSAVSAGVGAGVGGVAMSATDSTIIASATQSATTAAIRGGDIQNAVAGSLLQSGIASVSQLDFRTPTVDDSISLNDYATGATDYSLDPITGTFMPSTETAPFGDITFSDMPATFDYTTPVVAAGGTFPPPGPSGIVASAGGIDLTALAVTGLKLVQAWNTAGRPMPRVSTSAARANPDGTLTQVGAGGVPISARMPVGTPYLLDDGSLVTNNGDGTYTVVAKNGSVSTHQYAATSTLGKLFGGMNSGALVPALAIGAVLLVVMSRRGN